MLECLEAKGWTLKEQKYTLSGGANLKGYIASRKEGLEVVTHPNFVLSPDVLELITDKQRRKTIFFWTPILGVEPVVMNFNFWKKIMNLYHDLERGDTSDFIKIDKEMTTTISYISVVSSDKRDIQILLEVTEYMYTIQVSKQLWEE